MPGGDGDIARAEARALAVSIGGPRCQFREGPESGGVPLAGAISRSDRRSGGTLAPPESSTIQISDGGGDGGAGATTGTMSAGADSVGAAVFTGATR